MLHRLFMCGAGGGPVTFRDEEGWWSSVAAEEAPFVAAWLSSSDSGPVTVGGGILEVQETDASMWTFSEMPSPFVAAWLASGPSILNPAPPPQITSFTKGVWNSRPYTTAVPPWEAFTGESLILAMDFVDHRQGFGAVANPSHLQLWGTWLNGAQGRKFMISLPPAVWLSGTTTLQFTHAQIAAGSADSYFQTLADNLASWGLLGDAQHEVYIRLGWEIESHTFPFRVELSSPTTWTSMYRRIRSVMRARQPTNQWKWGTCFVNEYSLTDLQQMWPGDAETDWIGDDVYDQSWVTNTYPYPPGASESEKLARQQTAWNDIKSKLDMLVSFLNTKGGKPLMFPEWGVINRPDGHGGLDNPYYIEQMFNFMSNATNNVVGEVYFIINPSGSFDTDLIPPTQFPNASTKFLQLFYP